jgi:hypothetical protein
MDDNISSVRKYMETLNLSKRNKEEVENVILGYMSDLQAIEAKADKLEKALEAIKLHIEAKGGDLMKSSILVSTVWQYANKALND